MNNFRRRVLLSSSGGIDVDPTTGRGMIGNYEIVDLGLSNGLLFATCNVGTTKETEYGDYYKYGYGSTTYAPSQSYYRGTENPLASSADTATQVMGLGWRMPTQAELQDLINNTNYSWTTINGINGGKFTSKTNPNAYVFFPAAGCYENGSLYNEGDISYVWSSTPNQENIAYYLDLYSGDKLVLYIRRNSGLSVRGVYVTS